MPPSDQTKPYTPSKCRLKFPNILKLYETMVIWVMTKHGKVLTMSSNARQPPGWKVSLTLADESKLLRNLCGCI